MAEQNTSSRVKRSFRSFVLGGTAVALVMGGAVLGTSTDLMRSTPAYADPVRVEGVAPFSFADVVEQVRPAVVSVRVRSAQTVSLDEDSDQLEDFFDNLPPGMDRFFDNFRNRMPRDSQPRRRPSTGLGSGFVISEDGFIVTNNHVIDENDSVEVIFDDGREFMAEVVGVDDRTDLALLKIDVDEELAYVQFSHDDPRIGDWVVAVGNPFGLGGTVTAGIISANGRQIGAGPYDDFLQIDAAVNRGNSGGPAFNYRGEVVGVNTAIFSPSGGNVGIAFAIPASTAERVILDLMDDGNVVRGWLGVQIQTITDDIAASLGLDDERGALINELTPGSPSAGHLQIGDAVLSVNGRAIEDSRDLALRIGGMGPGEVANVRILRDGAFMEIPVELGTLPTTDKLASLVAPQGSGDAEEEMPETTALASFGLSLTASDNGLGVTITEVDPNSQAAERGVQPGDVILSVGDSDVASPADVERQIAAARDAGLAAVLMRVQTGDRARFVALPLSGS